MASLFFFLFFLLLDNGTFFLVPSPLSKPQGGLSMFNRVRLVNRDTKRRHRVFTCVQEDLLVSRNGCVHTRKRSRKSVWIIYKKNKKK